jgi:hypothetical protein
MGLELWDGTLRLLAGRIPSLQAMGWDSTPFGEENHEPTGNGMGLYAFWRGESLAYLFYSSLRVYGEGLGQWDGTLRLLARRSPSICVYCEGPGQEFRLCFVSLKYMSVTLRITESAATSGGQARGSPPGHRESAVR